MRGTNVQLMYFKCHKVNFRRGILIDWIKKKKVSINPKNVLNMGNVLNMQQLLHYIMEKLSGIQ